MRSIRTKKEIEVEIDKLNHGLNTMQIPLFSGFGDDNHAATNAQLEVLDQARRTGVVLTSASHESEFFDDVQDVIEWLIDEEPSDYLDTVSDGWGIDLDKD